ncbi:hypothetical protein WR25_13728 [Diploscapter pachys]|uniref:Protein XRP2 n=1 Tax=Diploscapter pachys TaxID=2018661 RepID=A0A2A2J684_9BILA|nr:hypothetical protein WR25_13728 [Diploscapter pachys]
MAGIVFMAPTMFCCFKMHRRSRADRYKVDEQEVKQDAEKKNEPQFSWDKREDVDMQRYLIRDVQGGTRVRQRGGKDPLQVENCSNANIVILSSTASLTIDDCKQCFIVIGPCAGSVFLRDCSDCTILCACQQLRTRDCARIELALHCATQPIIENSTNMVFHPLVINYPGFREEMALAGLSVFHHHGKTVHDFTPSKGSSNYKISPDPLSCSANQMQCIHENTITIEAEKSAIPVLHKVDYDNVEKHHAYSIIQNGESESEFVERCADFGKLISMTHRLKLVSTHDIMLTHNEATFLPEGKLTDFLLKLREK